MNPSMHYFIRTILIWLFCLLSVLLHELGHALGYRISAGKAEWKVIAGSGPRIIGRSKYIFCLIPAGGYFIPREEPETNKAKDFNAFRRPLPFLAAGLPVRIHSFLHSGFCSTRKQPVRNPAPGICLPFVFQFLSVLIHCHPGSLQGYMQGT